MSIADWNIEAVKFIFTRSKLFSFTEPFVNRGKFLNVYLA